MNFLNSVQLRTLSTASCRSPTQTCLSSRENSMVWLTHESRGVILLGDATENHYQEFIWGVAVHDHPMEYAVGILSSFVVERFSLQVGSEFTVLSFPTLWVNSSSPRNPLGTISHLWGHLVFTCSRQGWVHNLLGLVQNENSGPLFQKAGEKGH